MMRVRSNYLWREADKNDFFIKLMVHPNKQKEEFCYLLV